MRDVLLIDSLLQFTIYVLSIDSLSVLLVLSMVIFNFHTTRKKMKAVGFIVFQMEVYSLHVYIEYVSKRK